MISSRIKLKTKPGRKVSKSSKSIDKDIIEKPNGKRGLKNKKLEASLKELWTIQKQVATRK
jgi:hypothetical protein